MTNASWINFSAFEVDLYDRHMPAVAMNVARQWGNAGAQLVDARWTSAGTSSGSDISAVSADYAFDGRTAIQTKVASTHTGDLYFNVKFDKVRQFDCVSILHHNIDTFNSYYDKLTVEVQGDQGGSWLPVVSRSSVPVGNAKRNANIHLWNNRADGNIASGWPQPVTGVLYLRIKFNRKVGSSGATNPSIGQIFIGSRKFFPVSPNLPWDGASSHARSWIDTDPMWQDDMVDDFEMHNGDIQRYIRWRGRARRSYSATLHEGNQSGFPLREWYYGTDRFTQPFMWQDASYHSRASPAHMPMFMLMEDPQLAMPYEEYNAREIELSFNELPPFRSNSNHIEPGGGNAVADIGVWTNGW